MMTMPGTRPTTAREEGKESIPLLTISAIIRTATSSHDSVLYLICGGGQSQSTASDLRIGKMYPILRRLGISDEKSRLKYERRAPPHGQRRLYRRSLVAHSASLHLRERATRMTSSRTCSTTLFQPKRLHSLPGKKKESMCMSMMHDADAVVVSRPTGCSCKRYVRPDCPNRKVFSDQMISVGN